MASKIAVLGERAEGERRVAATPETVRKLIALGARLAVEGGVGRAAAISARFCGLGWTGRAV